MSKHVTEWLNAYLDGELRGARLQQVEEHLAECEACQLELASLQDLSRVLQEAPAPEFTSPEHFAAQVNLLLPQRPVSPLRNQPREIVWWLIPVGLIAVWVFISTSLLLSDALAVADNFGLLDSRTASFVASPSESADWTSTLGRFGLLTGNNLQWAVTTESFTRNTLPPMVWQFSVAMLYITWLALWWTRHTHQGRGLFLEG